MPGLVPGIHVLLSSHQDVDGLVKPGHDGKCVVASRVNHSPSTALVIMLRWISLEPP
jgi:hypothetical protein